MIISSASEIPIPRIAYFNRVNRMLDNREQVARCRVHRNALSSYNIDYVYICWVVSKLLRAYLRHFLRQIP